jgi:hypothetical protein
VRVRRVLASAAAALLVATGLVMAGAGPASADQIWQQQVGRASADAKCDIPAVAGDAAGWSAWAPSWAQWPNDGKGGWVCERTILWAKDSPPPSACTDIYRGIQFVFLDPSGFIPSGSPFYSDPACANYAGDAVGVYGFAYTSGGQAAAAAICIAGNPGVLFMSATVNEANLFNCFID